MKLEDYKLKDVFGVGNHKIGKDVLTFSIPAGSSCPGKTKTCSELCFAMEGFFLMPSVKKRLAFNWKLSRCKDFGLLLDHLLHEYKHENPRLRIHPSGDFYNADYVDKWYYALERNPQIRTWVYTRSWRVDKIRPSIVKLSKLKNVYLWYSCDRDTGKPKSIPKRVRTAYLQAANDDIPSWHPDLYFRDYPDRKSIVKRINGDLMCPHENGVNHKLTCQVCNICLSDPRPKPQATDIKVYSSFEEVSKQTSGRIALPVLV